MKPLTPKALLRRNALKSAAKQKRLDAVVTTQPLVQGDVIRRAVTPSPAYRIAQPMAQVNADSSSKPDQQPLKRTTVSKEGTVSTFVRLPPGQRPIQRPILKTWDPSPTAVRRVKAKRRHRPFLNSDYLSRAGFGDFAQLDSVFEKDVTFVAIDTETERSGLLRNVVEIGISTLEARDVSNVAPGRHADNWVSCMKHNHIVVAGARHTHRRVGGSKFAWSTLLPVDDVKAKVLEILKSIQPRDGRRKIAFVGHSLQGDLTSLVKSPGLQLDLLDSDAVGLDIVANFDTYLLGQLWMQAGAFVPDLSLSGLARTAGVNPKYFYNKKLRGWHNASNDAAYTMMVLLRLLAKRRAVKDDGDSSKLNSIPGATTAPPTPSKRGWGARIVDFLHKLVAR